MYISKVDYFKDRLDTLTYDTLTSVLSRKSMEEYINYLISNKTSFSMFLIDIDDFKTINDVLGHSAGDQSLLICSKRMIEVFKEHKGVVGRYGGDEFFAILPNEIEYENVWNVGNKLNENIRKSNSIPDIEKALPAGKFTITSGVARYPLDANDYESLLSLCDKALYIGKQKGKNRFIVYNAEIHQDVFKNRDYKKSDVKEVIDYVFQELTNKSASLDENLITAISFVSKCYDVSLASKCINDNLEILYSDGKITKAKYIDINEYLDLKASEVDTMIFMYINKLGPKHLKLKKQFEEQGIHASILIPCRTKSMNYGYLRIDAKYERIWSKEEKTVFQIIANLYALLLENKTN